MSHLMDVIFQPGKNFGLGFFASELLSLCEHITINVLRHYVGSVLVEGGTIDLWDWDRCPPGDDMHHRRF